MASLDLIKIQIKLFHLSPSTHALIRPVRTVESAVATPLGRNANAVGTLEGVVLAFGRLAV